MSKFIRIQSTKNIEVTEGLQSIDMTNRDAHVPDRFRVASAWVQTRVLIREGAGYYPAIIKDWGSVKALQKDGVLTLGEETDECDDPVANETYERVMREKEKYLQRAAAAKADAINGAKSTGARKVVRKTIEVDTTEPGDMIDG